MFQEKVTQSRNDTQKRKKNINRNNLESNKESLLNAIAESKNSENKYREIVESGQNEGESVEEYNKRRASAYSEWQNKAKVESIMEKDYSSSKTLYDKTSSSKRYRSHKTSNVITKKSTESNQEVISEVNNTISENINKLN